ncbi:MAG TPA: helix-turn-helix domain-containing protein, partial [Chloroflexota bacterium]|nr:helix-turn-helix domain-containing protein [Chloroflexota bacterium]
GASPYTTPNEVAATLNVSRFWVYRAMRTGLLRGRKLGKLVRVERASMEEYLTTRAQEEPAPPPPAIDQVRALLPSLSADERRQIAVEALTIEVHGLPATEGDA